MTPSATTPRRFARAGLAVFAAVWLMLVAVPPVAFLRWRESRLAEISVPAAQQEWDRFRDDMRDQAGDRGPVRRKVPRSAEPPELVWLRDYPLVAVAAWVIFVGLLAAVIGLLVRGAVATPGSPRVSGPG